MYYLKNKYFTRWARKQGITDKILWEAINEFKNGLFEADLGNHLFKKRIALAGRGKSSGTRTILFYQKDRKLIFCFGFEKSQQDNLGRYEFNFLNELSDNYQILPEEEVIKMIKNNRFFEISRMES